MSVDLLHSYMMMMIVKLKLHSYDFPFMLYILLYETIPELMPFTLQRYLFLLL